MATAYIELDRYWPGIEVSTYDWLTIDGEYVPARFDPDFGGWL